MSLKVVEPTFASKAMAEAYVQSQPYVSAYIIQTDVNVWVVYLVQSS